MEQTNEYGFKVGDRVRILRCPIPGIKGKEGVVTQLGGAATPEEGAVVTNETFPSGDGSYGEHGIWFPDNWIEKI